MLNTVASFHGKQPKRITRKKPDETKSQKDSKKEEGIKQKDIPTPIFEDTLKSKKLAKKAEEAWNARQMIAIKKEELNSPAKRSKKKVPKNKNALNLDLNSSAVKSAGKKSGEGLNISQENLSQSAFSGATGDNMTETRISQTAQTLNVSQNWVKNLTKNPRDFYICEENPKAGREQNKVYPTAWNEK